MKKPKINVTGITTDGSLVIDGAFKFVDTYGLPLADQMRSAQSMGLTVSLYCFVLDATKAGWKTRKIISYIRGEMLFAGLHECWPDVERKILLTMGQNETTEMG